MSKAKSVKEVLSEVEQMSQTVLLSTRKIEITKAFKRLICLTSGQCVCDICDTWDKDLFIVFELGRCLVPPRFMQLCKERHYGTKRWAYIEPFYKALYKSLYADIDPDNEIIHSSGTYEDQKCIYQLSEKTKKDAMDLIRSKKIK